MSVTLADVKKQLMIMNADDMPDANITDYITKSGVLALQFESRLSGDTLDAVVMELVLEKAYTYFRMPEMATLKHNAAMDLISMATASYSQAGSMVDTVDTYPTKTIGRISNDLLRDLPGSYDTHNRRP
jgi:hypothetical protein